MRNPAAIEYVWADSEEEELGGVACGRAWRGGALDRAQWVSRIGSIAFMAKTGEHC
jgi:hypothetical protein